MKINAQWGSQCCLAPSELLIWLLLLGLFWFTFSLSNLVCFVCFFVFFFSVILINWVTKKTLLGSKVASVVCLETTLVLDPVNADVLWYGWGCIVKIWFGTRWCIFGKKVYVVAFTILYFMDFVRILKVMGVMHTAFLVYDEIFEVSRLISPVNTLVVYIWSFIIFQIAVEIRWLNFYKERVSTNIFTFKTFLSHILRNRLLRGQSLLVSMFVEKMVRNYLI